MTKNDELLFKCLKWDFWGALCALQIFCNYGKFDGAPTNKIIENTVTHEKRTWVEWKTVVLPTSREKTNKKTLEEVQWSAETSPDVILVREEEEEEDDLWRQDVTTDIGGDMHFRLLRLLDFRYDE